MALFQLSLSESGPYYISWTEEAPDTCFRDLRAMFGHNKDGLYTYMRKCLQDKSFMWLQKCELQEKFLLFSFILFPFFFFNIKNVLICITKSDMNLHVITKNHCEITSDRENSIIFRVFHINSNLHFISTDETLKSHFYFSGFCCVPPLFPCIKNQINTT